jgi:transposase
MARTEVCASRRQYLLSSLGPCSAIMLWRRSKTLYLPPYSPDLNPIEEFFAVLKSFVKRRWHEYEENLEQDFQVFLEWGMHRYYGNQIWHCQSILQARRCYGRRILNFWMLLLTKVPQSYIYCYPTGVIILPKWISQASICKHSAMSINTYRTVEATNILTSNVIVDLKFS